MPLARSILVFSVLASVPALADDSSPAPTPTPAAAPTAKAPKKAEPKPAAGGSLMVVAKDPVTGELRPATPAEREKLLGRRPLVSAAPETVTLPDGTVLLKERPEDANFAVATRNADGSLSYTCVHGAEAARAATPAATPAPKSADR